MNSERNFARWTQGPCHFGVRVLGALDGKPQDCVAMNMRVLGALDGKPQDCVAMNTSTAVPK